MEDIDYCPICGKEFSLSNIKDHIQEAHVKRFQDICDSREKLLENIVGSEKIIKFIPNHDNFLILAREWNSWYPSTFDVIGGCYILNINEEIILVDPGFNTLNLIKKNDLDIRLIKHVFITHFHPDHFENLAKILTMKTNEEKKMNIYLNTTAFDNFKIYSKAGTDFFELKPGMTIQVKTSKKTPYRISVTVIPAFHREIGGSMNSVGLKFEIVSTVDPKVNYKVGFMSDTDGLEEYIPIYVQNYDDCTILVPHIGAIHKHPEGYKHLYLDGIENLFQNLSDRERYIFLSEFGFELASPEDFLKAVDGLVPKAESYNSLVTDLFKITKELLNDEDMLKKEIISQIQVQRFMKLYTSLSKTSGNELYYELIAPLILFDDILTKVDPNIDIKKKFEKFYTKFTTSKKWFESDFSNLWTCFENVLIFEYEPLDVLRRTLNDFINYWDITYFKQNVDRFLDNILAFSTRTEMDQFWKLIYAPMKPHRNTFHETVKAKTSGLFDWILYEGCDLKINPIPKELGEGIGRNGINELFITFSLYMISRIPTLSSKTFENRLDRRDVCNLLRFQFKNLKILPAHESFKILFQSDGLWLTGRCSSREHHGVSRAKIDHYNSHWNYFKEGKQEPLQEYVDIIDENGCDICDARRKEKEEDMPTDDEIDEFYRDMAEEHLESVEDGRTTILDATEIDDISYIINNYNDEGIWEEILDEQVIEKVVALMESDLDNPLLIHPAFFSKQQLKDIIIGQLDALDEQSFFQRILDGLENAEFAILDSFDPVKFKKNVESDEYISEILKDPDFSRIFIRNIESLQDNERLNIILLICKYFSHLVSLSIQDTRNKEEEKQILKRLTVKIRESKAFHKFKALFVDLFLPILREPNQYKDDVKKLKEMQSSLELNKIFELLDMLGKPFGYYSKAIQELLSPTRKKLSVHKQLDDKSV